MFGWKWEEAELEVDMKSLTKVLMERSRGNTELFVATERAAILRRRIRIARSKCRPLRIACATTSLVHIKTIDSFVCPCLMTYPNAIRAADRERTGRGSDFFHWVVYNRLQGRCGIIAAAFTCIPWLVKDDRDFRWAKSQISQP